jgi:hypothetical protein
VSNGCTVMTRESPLRGETRNRGDETRGFPQGQVRPVSREPTVVGSVRWGVGRGIGCLGQLGGNRGSFFA